MIGLALSYATKAHSGQLRKYSGDPYILHPIRVASETMALCAKGIPPLDFFSMEGDRISDSPERIEYLVSVALLHDTLEDTECTASEICNLFGTLVTDGVLSLTNPSKNSGLPREERKRVDRDHISKQGPEIQTIKALDRIDNLRDISMAPQEFLKKYAMESILLAGALDKIDKVLKTRLLDSVSQITGSRKAWLAET